MHRLILACPLLLAAVGLFTTLAGSAQEPQKTYAERLGWKPDARVVIFHVDDAGMSHESNLGTIEAIEKGVATSTSIMFPCSWVSEFAAWLREHPDADAGVHLTLVSEWKGYRWAPVAGKKAVPGLTDPEGCLWPNSGQVYEHATPDEVEAEIRAQLDRALAMGIKPTHMDSHTGTLFGKPEYAERLVKVGAEYGIPILCASGPAPYLTQENAEILGTIRAMAEKAWAAGLPVLDDVHTATYSWKDAAEKKTKIAEVLRGLKPGITEIILHCTKTSEHFDAICGSGVSRQADLTIMTDPEIRQLLQEQGIQLTTWRELKQRRDAAK